MATLQAPFLDILSIKVIAKKIVHNIADFKTLKALYLSTFSINEHGKNANPEYVELRRMIIIRYFNIIYQQLNRGTLKR
jgi:hypothetical protein